jgi:hypothetical protein
VSPAVRVVLGVTLAVASVLAMGAASRYSYTADPAQEAELRLTWRTRAPLVKECRRLTQEEQDALPAHMRREEICEGRVASYRLEVRVDGAVRHSATIRGAGARGDRPLYVFETLRLEPGHHEVHVVFERVGAEASDVAGDGSGPASDVADVGEPGRRAGSVPDRLELREGFDLAGRQVALVTYDAVERRLVLRTAPRR